MTTQTAYHTELYSVYMAAQLNCLLVLPGASIGNGGVQSGLDTASGTLPEDLVVVAPIEVISAEQASWEPQRIVRCP